MIAARPAAKCRVMALIGTRPEAIKMAPVIYRLLANPAFETCVCVTGQHREMLAPLLEFFGLEARYDLKVMGRGEGLSLLTAAVLAEMDRVLAEFKPDRLLVQGDTTTAFAGALAAFYRRIPVAHVEAGLRTGSMDAPWPEEANRRLLAVLSDLHFAPTDLACAQLTTEGVHRGAIHLTGNTVVDALMAVRARLKSDATLLQVIEREFRYLDPAKRLILVTSHRRESFGDGLDRICEAVKRLACLDGVEIVYPVHLNPQVKGPVHRYLGGLGNVHLVEPLNYPHFVYLMQRAALILTDSGGIQEEAPSLGTPVLVMRDVTERTEALAKGLVELVGTDVAAIVEAAQRVLRGGRGAGLVADRQNPFGDGHASDRIVSILEELWTRGASADVPRHAAGAPGSGNEKYAKKA